MPQTLGWSFYFRCRYLRGRPYSLWGVIIFWGIKRLGSLNSLLNSNWGVLNDQGALVLGSQYLRVTSTWGVLLHL